MSVLDRAIVKAFERRRNDPPLPKADVEPPRAVVADAMSAPVSATADVDDYLEPRLDGTTSSPSAPQSACEPDSENRATVARFSEPSAGCAFESESPRQVTLDVVEPPVGSDSQPIDSPPQWETASELDRSESIGQIALKEIEELRTELAQSQSAAVPPPLPASMPPSAQPGFYKTQRETAAIPTSPSVPVGPSISHDWKWPEICEQLDQFTGDGFRQLAKHLQFAAAQGHKVLAFVSSARAVGRTSVLLTLTRILALEGRTHALLIDADRHHPDIAKSTGMAATAGLIEVLHGQVQFDQAIVQGTPGNISCLTLQTAVSDAEWTGVTAAMRGLVQQARQDYEMVLIDAGVLGPGTRLADCWLRGAADAVITISRQLSDHNTAHQVLNWKQIGIESLGVIETFA